MRFIGREQELALLERLYQSEQFEFLVLYGKRFTIECLTKKSTS